MRYGVNIDPNGGYLSPEFGLCSSFSSAIVSVKLWACKFTCMVKVVTHTLYIWGQKTGNGPFLLTGRCCEAEICAILLLLRCSFIWYPFWPKSKFSISGQKPWTIIRRFYRNQGDFLRVLLLHSGRCYEAEICVILFLLRCPFIWYPLLLKLKFSDFGQKPWTIIRRFYRN